MTLLWFVDFTERKTLFLLILKEKYGIFSAFLGYFDPKMRQKARIHLFFQRPDPLFLGPLIGPLTPFFY